LDDLRSGLEILKLAPREAAPSDFLVRFTYNTNAIEGNPLTLRQTALLLVDGITPEGTRTEHTIEALNARDAWEYVSSFRGSMSRTYLCKVQFLVTKGTPCRIQGGYRDSEVRIAGSDWTPPPASRVPAETDRIFQKFRSERRTSHPVERAARLHNRIARVHPFVDGNGRTARLLMNWTLLKGKFPPVIIEARNKEEYYAMIERGDSGNDAPFARFLAHQLLDQYLQLSKTQSP
jgi:Fic family protein